MRLESKVGESLSGFVISPSVALTATAPSSEGASETSCVLYDILFRQTEQAFRGERLLAVAVYSLFSGKGRQLLEGLCHDSV